MFIDNKPKQKSRCRKTAQKQTLVSSCKSHSVAADNTKQQGKLDQSHIYAALPPPQQQQQQPFNGRLSGTTRVGRYQKKHPGQRTSFITFLHLQRSTASSLFSLRA